jgi:hypothetical protein
MGIYLESGETRNEYRILMEKPLGESPLGRPRKLGG